MSWHGHGRGTRRGYHHGNLREALVEAALELIGAKGPAGFTFAEAARHAGVSPAAPYRHFRDRDALLSEVAQRGFQRFEQQLAAAWDEGRPNLRDGLRPARQGLSRLRPQRARLFLGHVRIRPLAHRAPRAAAGRATAPSPCCAAPARR